MQKKEYERPSVEVVVLKQQAQLLAGSAVGGGVDPLSPFAPDPNPDPLNP